MKKTDPQHETMDVGQEREAIQPIPVDLIPIPRIVPASGLYAAGQTIAGPEHAFTDLEGATLPDPIPKPIFREELRLDVDGHYPQMVASGFIQLNLASTIHWVANIKAAGANTWIGGIWYKNGAVASFPYSEVKITILKPSIFTPPQMASVTLMGAGIRPRMRSLTYVSPYFHPAEFEYDWEQGITPVTQIKTYDHPNHPATIPNENLSIETVYRRAGINATVSPNCNSVGLAPGGYWSDMEMHDAMQIFWSRFANKPQWAMWVLFAGLHEGNTPNVPDPNLGGIMFDDIGPNERQGTSLFLKSFIANAPAGDPNPAAWVKRMFFWTACHEMGHAFNLAHSWQKALVSGGHGPWIPLANDPQARSFMNYPYVVAGGEAAFFANFEFRFTNQELVFMRHAPGKFVQQGNAEWFDNHGFRRANALTSPTLRLEMRANRPKTHYEFLEPITLELKLTNVSTQLQLIPADILSRVENMTVISKLDGRTAKQYTPMARYCTKPDVRSLAPGESVYDSLFISADKNGWGLADPGNYRVQTVLHLENEDIVSAPISLRITPPLSHDEEVIAQDYFSKDVGRVLTFDGSQVLESANNTLMEITGKLADRRVARHAHVALGNALARPYKIPYFQEGGAEAAPTMEIRKREPNITEARKHLDKALTEHMEISAESLGHIDYTYYVERMADFLERQGDAAQAARVLTDMQKIMAARGVIARVLDEIKRKAEGYAKPKSASVVV